MDTPKGDPRKPPTNQELEEKSRTLVPVALSKLKMDRLVKTIWGLEKLRNLRQLIRLCY